MANPIYQKEAKIVYNGHIISNYYRLALDLPEVACVAQPGQFVMLRIDKGYKPFLRRPLSIHRVNPQIEILYEVVGIGTELLSRKKPGQCLSVLGPLGNGFDLSAIRYPLSAILVAGGMGIAPLLFLAQRLIERYPLPVTRYPIALLGAKTKKEILSQKEFANLGLNVKISTDDGTAGFKGKVTELLKKLLRQAHDVRRATIYACGPKPMLSEIAIISKQYNITAQISLDEYMACGLGVCLGCMIETKKGYQRVCQEGPVFDSTVMMQERRDRS